MYGLTCWRMEMEKVAVFPVPDCAWAITSWPFTTGTIARCWMAEGRSKLQKKIHVRRHHIISVNHSPVSIDSTKEFWLQVHVIKAKRAQWQIMRCSVTTIQDHTHLSTTWSQLDSISFSRTSWNSSLWTKNEKASWQTFEAIVHTMTWIASYRYVKNPLDDARKINSQVDQLG